MHAPSTFPRTPLRLLLVLPLALLLAACQDRPLPTGLPSEGADLALLPVGCDVGALVAAIETANSTEGPSTIKLAAGCTYTLTSVHSGFNGLPAITGNVTIEGNGATIRRSAADETPEFRIFQIVPGADVSIFDLTISGGRLGPAGGGIANHGTLTLTRSTVSGNRSGWLGGGIDNGTGGTLTLIHSTISGNSTPAGGGGLVSWGPLTLIHSTISGNTASWAGGILNNHAATLSRSTVSNNSATWGGGISNFAPLTISNSTFSGNSAGIHGGGIDNTAAGTLIVRHSTFSGNSAPTGGGIYNQGGAVSLGHTIIANSPSGGNCGGSGTVVDAGYNLESANTCGFTAAGSLSNTDPQLGPLADNGGPTRTHTLRPGSPAIDAGDPAFQTGSILWDQRGTGFPRQVGSRLDIGAVERRGQQ